jgi:hypothetical protein
MAKTIKWIWAQTIALLNTVPVWFVANPGFPPDYYKELIKHQNLKEKIMSIHFIFAIVCL